MATLNVACIQMRSSDDIDDNIAAASALIRLARAEGAQFAATPEMTSLMDQRPGALAAKVVAEADDRALKAFRALAVETGMTLLLGSLPIRVGPDLCANRSFLVAPTGDILARYDKIHMFDVEVGDGQTYRESRDYRPGEHSVVVDLETVGLAARIGLSVCYDVRFPALYRTLAQSGAEILCVPAAFTHITGKAHWRALLVARAIENGAFVLAPNQGGKHADGRETFGHSLIIGPWGDVIAEGGTDPGVIGATIDLEQVALTRRRIPSLNHDRPFAPPARTTPL
jgi:predicted amidohydrolase